MRVSSAYFLGAGMVVSMITTAPLQHAIDAAVQRWLQGSLSCPPPTGVRAMILLY